MKSIRPVTHSFRLHDFRGGVTADISIRKNRLLFSVDIYSYLRQEHPETHLGWWAFPLEVGEYKIQVHVDFRTTTRDSVKLIINGEKIGCADSWLNPSYLLDPLQDLQLVLRKDNEIQELDHVIMKIDDPLVLKQFYSRLHAVGGYGTSLPFLPTMHYYKLDVLKRFFLKYIPKGGNSLDLGCGRSLFTEIQSHWPFRVFSGDLDIGLIQSRKAEVPQNFWFVSDASHAPFKTEYFDALFVGEIIEHISDPVPVLKEWMRVLKPGGVLILTTPNRERLLARIEGRERPYSPDHLHEFSYHELKNEVLPKAGLSVVDEHGVYLELLLNWLSGNPRRDYLQAEWNKPVFIPLMKFFNRMGNLFPQYSLDMIFVCRKS